MTLEFDGIARWVADRDGSYLCIPVSSPAAATEVLDKLTPGKTYTVEIKERRNKRSLTANAYYHVLVYQVAQYLGVSTTRVHNMMLRRYAPPMLVDGKLLYAMVPDTEESEETALEMETLHIKPTAQTRGEYRGYIVLKGSHLFDTKEMAALINGIVDECHQMGIETRPQEEVDALLAQWDAQTDKADSNTGQG